MRRSGDLDSDLPEVLLEALTDEPFELDRPAHMDTLKRAYERFPEIGGRSAR